MAKKIITGKTEDGIEIEYQARMKPITTTKKTPEEPQGRDTFETPNYATDLIVPFIPKKVTHIWECAAGNRRIANRLEHHGYNVFATDIRNIENVALYNFITDPKRTNIDDKYAIITNPPYSIKELFIKKAMEYGVPFAFLINADYSGQQIKWIKDYGLEKLVPNRRISYITPNVVNRVNEGEGTGYLVVDEIPTKLLAKYSSSQFHSMYLCGNFNLGKTETFVELSNWEIKNNII